MTDQNKRLNVRSHDGFGGLRDICDVIYTHDELISSKRILNVSCVRLTLHWQSSQEQRENIYCVAFCSNTFRLSPLPLRYQSYSYLCAEQSVDMDASHICSYERYCWSHLLFYKRKGAKFEIFVGFLLRDVIQTYKEVLTFLPIAPSGPKSPGGPGKPWTQNKYVIDSHWQ